MPPHQLSPYGLLHSQNTVFLGHERDKKTSKAPARSPASTPRVRGLTNGIHAEQLYIEPLIPSGQQSKLQKMQQPPKRAKREEIGNKTSS